MIFEGANSAFSSISSVHVWWYKLKLAFVSSDGSLESGAGFVVHDVEVRRRPCCDQSGVDIVVGWNVMRVVFGGKRADKYGV